MSAPAKSGGEPVTSKAQLIEYMESGSKPKSAWRIGTEHEKFGFSDDDLRPLPYEGPRGIRRMLEGLRKYGWKPVEENGNVIALVDDAGGSITLEPGGQLELSGAAVQNIHQTCAEVYQHLKQVKEVAAELGVSFIGLGFQPKWKREEIPWMPKGRYRIMRDYMPKKGKLGLDMMLRTCTVQVNLDFSDEADMIKKFRVSLALQPLATALFANSPFIEGKPSGFLSARSHTWTDTDPDRSGMLPFVFEQGMGFERYVDYLLDLPMYFVYRDGQYIDASGQSFRDFMQGRLPAYPGELPTLGDWGDHITTAFPEVRLKKFLEMRGADGGPWRRLCALPALWVGLLYDQGALDAAWDMVKDWTVDEQQRLREGVTRTALATEFRGRKLQALALEMLAIAREGLKQRDVGSTCGEDETAFLDPLQQIAESGITPAEELLAAYHGRWNGSVDPVFREYAY
jgi:glutamate--cysteine ligase